MSDIMHTNHLYGISNVRTSMYVLKKYQYQPFFCPVSMHWYPKSVTSLPEVEKYDWENTPKYDPTKIHDWTKYK